MPQVSFLIDILLNIRLSESFDEKGLPAPMRGCVAGGIPGDTVKDSIEKDKVITIWRTF
jgi:hypothetical protein